MDEGGFILDYIMPAGSSLAETNRVITHVEEILRKTPEVESTSRRTGLQLGLAAVTEANTGDISVKLKRDRNRGGDEVIADVRAQDQEAEPELDVEFTQLLQDMIGDLTSAPEPVVIKLFAEDPELLHALGAAGGRPPSRRSPAWSTCWTASRTPSADRRHLHAWIPPSPRAPASRPRKWRLDASAILQGEPAPPPVVVNDRSYTIRVRFPDAHARLAGRHPQHPAGQRHRQDRHHRLAGQRWSEIPGQTEIRRENLQRNVQVTARFEGLNLGDGMTKVQEAVADLNLPPTIRVEYGGQFEEQQKSFKDLAFVLVLAIVLVFIVLLFEFGKFAAPIAILASALLSTCGVFPGAADHRHHLQPLVVHGADHGDRHRGQERHPAARRRCRSSAPKACAAEDAMIHAGERRLRPIMMTALATVAGMIPLALALGAGSQMLQPLAIAVIGGIARLDGSVPDGHPGRPLLHWRPAPNKEYPPMKTSSLRNTPGRAGFGAKATRFSTRSKSAAPAVGTISPWTRRRAASTSRTAPVWKWWIR